VFVFLFVVTPLRRETGQRGRGKGRGVEA